MYLLNYPLTVPTITMLLQKTAKSTLMLTESQMDNLGKCIKFHDYSKNNVSILDSAIFWE